MGPSQPQNLAFPASGPMAWSRAVFENMAVAANGARRAAQGKAARVFVRPNELEIERQAPNGDAVAARIVRIQSAGPIVPVELSRIDATDKPGDAVSDSMNVELPHDRYRTLGLSVGETVFVKVRDARVVAEDDRN